MNIKSLMHEFSSRKPEVAIADALIRHASNAVFTTVFLLFIFFWGLGRKYLSSIRGVLTPDASWLIGGIWICIVGAIISYKNFTYRGRRSQLRRVLRLLRQYSRFDREKELEVISRIHSQTCGAALVFLATCLFSLPLVAVVWFLHGVAVIVDITNNIKGTHIQPTFGPKLFFNAYGVVLGALFSWTAQLLQSARSQSLLLSAKHRRATILRWRAKVIKIKSKLQKCRRTKTPARTSAASA